MNLSRPKNTKSLTKHQCNESQPSDRWAHTPPASTLPPPSGPLPRPVPPIYAAPSPRRRRRAHRRRRRTRRRPAMMPVRAYHHHHHHNNNNHHNHRLRRIIPRVLLAVFAIYAVSFAVYLLRQSPHPSADREGEAVAVAVAEEEDHEKVRVTASQKPWPRLPSYLPWTSGSVQPPPHSCEGYFGNGFSRLVDVLPARGGGGGWFRCHHSETLRSSICEGGRVRLDPGLIAMSRGGEPLDQVMGRAEEEEVPKYEPGALQVEGAAAKRTGPLVEPGFLDAYVPTGGIGMHTMRSLLDSAHVVPPGVLHCSKWVEEPTLLVTRFEYANLFHTITDWYSAYVSSRVTDLPERPNVVFVDGHCKI
ncbi:hypothetical protein E2562_018116 [Oryza meyeriana var. granulata]|uniref:Uncharacterized protein n=1 Tax=Oryza meyeriana var. granulata TaxID=110450 RepID=A0A6G1C748_9ORYZ|nr:hypothetical protein E2562_018116 [Oryza meyeriana var. granulata]